MRAQRCITGDDAWVFHQMGCNAMQKDRAAEMVLWMTSVRLMMMREGIHAWASRVHEWMWRLDLTPQTQLPPAATATAAHVVAVADTVVGAAVDAEV